MDAPSVSYQGMSVPVPDLMNTPCSNEAMLRTDLPGSLPDHAYTTMLIAGIAVQRSEALTEALRA